MTKEKEQYTKLSLCAEFEEESNEVESIICKKEKALAIKPDELNVFTTY